MMPLWEGEGEGGEMGEGYVVQQDMLLNGWYWAQMGFVI